MFKRLLQIALGSGKKEITYLVYPNRRVFVIDLPPELSAPGTYRVTRHAGELYLSVEAPDGQVRPEQTYAEIQRIERLLQ